MLVSPAPVYSAVSVIPSTFSAWSSQVPDKLDHIQAAYAPFDLVVISKVGGLLSMITISDKGNEVVFCICVEKGGGLASLYILPLYGLRTASFGDVDEGEAMYAWVADTLSGQSVVWLHSVYISIRFMIRLDILPANLQLAVTSPIWKTSLSLCLEPVYDLT